eukprot:scaffold17853_cov65-Cyclotella_meneghiniana.AAC.2
MMNDVTAKVPLLIAVTSSPTVRSATQASTSPKTGAAVSNSKSRSSEPSQHPLSVRKPMPKHHHHKATPDRLRSTVTKKALRESSGAKLEVGSCVRHTRHSIVRAEDLIRNADRSENVHDNIPAPPQPSCQLGQSQPRLQLIMLSYNPKCFPMYNPKYPADIPSQLSSEIGIKSNLERAEMDYHDIKVADVTASKATATGFAATENVALKIVSRSQLGDDDNAPTIELKVRTDYIHANYSTS